MILLTKVDEMIFFKSLKILFQDFSSKIILHIFLGHLSRFFQAFSLIFVFMAKKLFEDFPVQTMNSL